MDILTFSNTVSLFKQPNILKGTCNARCNHLMRLLSIHFFSAQIKRALCRLIYTRQQIENRCLTCPVRSDQSDQLRLPDLHIEIVHRLQAAELYAEMACF